MDTSPCSVPDWLRFLFPLETPRQQQACRIHDARYGRGGSHEQRLWADLHFALDLLSAHMDPDRVEQYYWGVRQFGGPHWLGGDTPGACPVVPSSPDAVDAP